VYSLAWLVVVGVMGLILGAWIGHVVARVRSGYAARIQDLEAQLSASHDELSDYKSEVYEQFSKTARKFKALDETYHDLHRQLAESAGALVGEGAGPLLEAPREVAAVGSGEPAESAQLSAESLAMQAEEGAEGADAVAASTLAEADADAEAPILVNEADSQHLDEPVEGDLLADLGDEETSSTADQPVAEHESLQPAADNVDSDASERKVAGT
jgi:uncharacterized membrane-anchored protein YhcB (DUF1043 family)